MNPVKADPTVAGVFSRHLPRRDCFPLIESEIKGPFPMQSKKIAYEDYLKAAKSRDYVSQRKLTHFSTVSALIRKDVWQKAPFNEKLVFAEDQGWAKDVLERGYALAYAADSKVWHSHNYSIVEWCRIKYLSFFSFIYLFKRPWLQTVLILPEMLINLLNCVIYIKERRMNFSTKSKEMARAILYILLAAAARLIAFLAWLFHRKDAIFSR